MTTVEQQWSRDALRFHNDDIDLIHRRQAEFANMIADISGSPVTFGNELEVMYGHEFFPRFERDVREGKGNVGLVTYEMHPGDNCDSMCRAMGDAVRQGRRVTMVADGQSGADISGTLIYGRGRS